MLEQIRPAIEAFMESLRLNPGNDYSYLGVEGEDVQRLFDQALIVKYDLEFLFRENSSQQQQSARRQPGEPGDEGDTPVPGWVSLDLPATGKEEKAAAMISSRKECKSCSG